MSSDQKIIYKYRDWNNDNHKRILINRELYLSSPKDFNDPFDCRITKNFDALDNDEKIWQFVKQTSKSNISELLKRGENINEYELKLFNRFKYNKIKEQKTWDDYMFREQDEYFGIISFSEIWDSILMWGHYASNHTGFCVGFDINKIDNFGFHGPVNYCNNFPIIDPLQKVDLNLIIQETFSKATDWKYEKEYRITKLFYPKKPSREERRIRINDSCFSEIIIGLKFPYEHLSWIKNLAYEIGVKIYQIKQVPNMFKLSREEIY